MVNKRGPKQEPCGTPQVRLNLSERSVNRDLLRSSRQKFLQSLTLMNQGKAHDVLSN